VCHCCKQQDQLFSFSGRFGTASILKQQGLQHALDHFSTVCEHTGMAIISYKTRASFDYIAKFQGLIKANLKDCRDITEERLPELLTQSTALDVKKMAVSLAISENGSKFDVFRIRQCISKHMKKI